MKIKNLGVQIGQVSVCRDLNLELNAGENWVVLGPNGVGKTTLLHTLAGLRPAEYGTIDLNNTELFEMTARHRGQELAILLQQLEEPLAGNVRETILTGRHPHMSRWQWRDDDDFSRVDAALEAVGLTGFNHRSLSTLSGGERRRTEIATILVQDSAVCLWDEPTNHLDLKHQDRILHLITDHNKRNGRLNLMVMHDLNLSWRYASHALLLLGGGETRAGPIADLFESESLTRLYDCPIRAIRQNGETVWLAGTVART